MDETQRYLFDLNGYIVLRDVLGAAELAALNASADAAGVPELLRQNGYVHTRFPRLEGTGTAVADGPADPVDAFLTDWDEEFHSLADHPAVLPSLRTMLGPEPRVDHSYAIFMRSGTGETALHHRGKQFDPAQYYLVRDGRMFNATVVVSFALTDALPGDGGFCVIPGSHKSSYPLPDDIRGITGETPPFVQVPMNAGDAVIFTEAVTHGSIPWSGSHERRALLYKYTQGLTRPERKSSRPARRRRSAERQVPPLAGPHAHHRPRSTTRSSPAAAPTKVSIGIFAHNEAATIAAALRGFQTQETAAAAISEITVVCCGCTDNTVDIVSRIAQSDSRVTVVDRPRREGKTAAIDAFLAVAQSEIVLLSGADLIPAPGLVEQLVVPLINNENIAMTGARIASVHTDGSIGRLHSLLWDLHHEVSSRSPKLGETVAVRRSFIGPQLPTGIYCDEVLMEYVVVQQGGHLKYVPEATVHNFPPATLKHFYTQRRRIACQHIQAHRKLRYRPSTSSSKYILIALGKVARHSGNWISLMALALLELTARTHGRLDFLRGQHYRVWPQVGRRHSAVATET